MGLSTSEPTLAMSTGAVLAPASVTVSALTTTVPMGGWVTVTATVLSALETPVGNTAVVFSGEGAEFTLATGKTDPAGQYSTTVMPQRDARSTMTVTATATAEGDAVTSSVTLRVKAPLDAGEPSSRLFGAVAPYSIGAEG